MKLTAAASPQLKAAPRSVACDPAKAASRPVAASFMKVILGMPARKKGGVPPFSPKRSLSGSWLKGKFSIRLPTGASSEARFEPVSVSDRGARSNFTIVNRFCLIGNKDSYAKTREATRQVAKIRRRSRPEKFEQTTSA